MQAIQTINAANPGLPYPALTAKPPISDARLEANRRNAQKSTGPKTEEGKAVSRMNAFRHGLTGQISVLTEEDRAAKDKFTTTLIAAMQPEGAIEDQLALCIAEDHWRLNRARGMEDNIFALGHYTPAGDIEVENPELHAALTAARVFLESAKEFQLLTLYEQRIHRKMTLNTEKLESLQDTRKQARAEALEKAAICTRVAEFYEEKPELAANGFVFSNAEIKAYVRRKERLKEAAWRERAHWPNAPYPYEPGAND